MFPLPIYLFYIFPSFDTSLLDNEREHACQHSCTGHDCVQACFLSLSYDLLVRLGLFSLCLCFIDICDQVIMDLTQSLKLDFTLIIIIIAFL
ncbi:hypothetical protein F0562_021671 [Nyssa sinensis]|uniref:Uncharacterized protein n=1 Tax=Nyssa sinensis TaxID=561372 RepID=A0A5J5BKH7_9ASTE|nr:hypothetical protein F0562_021671 [Nyssa sinensis]